MTEHEHFLTAICDHPDDEVPRLIYADWLEEHRDPRGEFIRVQCERARLPDDDPRQRALVRRERQLFEKHLQQWTPAFGRGVRAAEFRRGFVEILHLSTLAFLRRGEKLFRQTPLRTVVLSAAHLEHMPALAASPLLSRLAGLRIFGPIMGDGAAMLLASPHLANLRELAMSNHALDPDDIAALLSASLPSLTRLMLDGNALDDPEAEALAASPSMTQIMEISLSANQIGDVGAAALARSSCLSSLRVLGLGWNRIRDRGAQALASSPQLQSLHYLDLHGNRIGDTGALPLACTPPLTRLRAPGLSPGRIRLAQEADSHASLGEAGDFLEPSDMFVTERTMFTPLGHGRPMVGLAP